MLMVMEILHPVHWTVRAFVDPADLRHMVWLVLSHPSLILRGIKFLLSKSPKYELPGEEAAEAPAAGVSAAAKAAPAKAPTAQPKAGPGPIPVRTGPGPIPSR
jgi:hypothetical protein